MPSNAGFRQGIDYFFAPRTNHLQMPKKRFGQEDLSHNCFRIKVAEFAVLIQLYWHDSDYLRLPSTILRPRYSNFFAVYLLKQLELHEWFRWRTPVAKGIATSKWNIFIGKLRLPALDFLFKSADQESHRHLLTLYIVTI